MTVRSVWVWDSRTAGSFRVLQPLLVTGVSCTEKKATDFDPRVREPVCFFKVTVLDNLV